MPVLRTGLPSLLLLLTGVGCTGHGGGSGSNDCLTLTPFAQDEELGCSEDPAPSFVQGQSRQFSMHAEGFPASVEIEAVDIPDGLAVSISIGADPRRGILEVFALEPFHPAPATFTLRASAAASTEEVEVTVYATPAGALFGDVELARDEDPSMSGGPGVEYFATDCLTNGIRRGRLIGSYSGTLVDGFHLDPDGAGPEVERQYCPDSLAIRDGVAYVAVSDSAGMESLLFEASIYSEGEAALVGQLPARATRIRIGDLGVPVAFVSYADATPLTQLALDTPGGLTAQLGPSSSGITDFAFQRETFVDPPDFIVLRATGDVERLDINGVSEGIIGTLPCPVTPGTRVEMTGYFGVDLVDSRLHSMAVSTGVVTDLRTGALPQTCDYGAVGLLFDLDAIVTGVPSEGTVFLERAMLAAPVPIASLSSSLDIALVAGTTNAYAYVTRPDFLARIDTSSGDESIVPLFPSPPYQLGPAILGPGGVIYAVSTTSGALMTVAENGLVATLASGFDTPSAVALENSGSVLVAHAAGLSRINTSTSAIEAIVSGSAVPYLGVAVSSPGIAVALRADGSIVEVSLNSGAITERYRGPDATGISVTADGSLLLRDDHGVVRLSETLRRVRFPVQRAVNIAVESSGGSILVLVDESATPAEELLRLTPD